MDDRSRPATFDEVIKIRTWAWEQAVSVIKYNVKPVQFGAKAEFTLSDVEEYALRLERYVFIGKFEEPAAAPDKQESNDHG